MRIKTLPVQGNQGHSTERKSLVTATCFLGARTSSRCRPRAVARRRAPDDPTPSAPAIVAHLA